MGVNGANGTPDTLAARWTYTNLYPRLPVKSTPTDMHCSLNPKPADNLGPYTLNPKTCVLPHRLPTQSRPPAQALEGSLGGPEGVRGP